MAHTSKNHKRKNSDLGKEKALKKAKKEAPEPTNTFLVTGLPLIARPCHIEEFCEAMVSCYFKKNVEGVSSRECHVYVADKERAKRVVKKDNTELLGRMVQVHKSSLTVNHLNAQKITGRVTRIRPFGFNISSSSIEKLVRQLYKSVQTVVVHEIDSPKIFKYKMAEVTFNTCSAAVQAMKKNEILMKNEPLSRYTLQKKYQIPLYIRLHRKEMFWS